MKNIFRVLTVALVLGIGVFSVLKAPEAVQSFLPKVETIKMTAAEYRETVSGAGVISKSGGIFFANVYIAECDIRKVKIGQQADIIGAAFDDGLYTATVTALDNDAVRRQGDYAYETMVGVTLKIDGVQDNPDNILRSGYTARAEIKTGEVKNVSIIPYGAVCQDDGGEYVYVLSGNTARRRGIVTGMELADGVQVTDGLGVNDEIIANPENMKDSRLVVKSRA